MINLGTMEQLTDLREVWKHEAHDFTKWLAEEENLMLLSNAVGIDIVLGEVESSVGSFNVDIFASEEGTGRKIVIENQLGNTDHDHLGKAITYAAGKGADVVIWVVKRARDEHRQAVEWLNQRTDENVGFFLVEIQLWKIDNSAPAVKFSVVERPNDWAKTLKIQSSLSPLQKLQVEFWHSFVNHAFAQDEFRKAFSSQKPQPQHWYNLAAGTSQYHISLTANTQKKRIGAEIYISDNKELFEQFKSQKADIEQELGMKLEWREASKACRILALQDGDIKNDSISWDTHFDWYCKMALQLKKVAKQYGG